MKMKFSHSISILAVSILIISAPLVRGMHPIRPGENSEPTKNIPLNAVTQKKMMMADTKVNTAGNKDPDTAGTQEVESDAEPSPEIDNEVPSAKSKSAPLKPFRPSEEIAAEQAVDFPVDI